MLTERYDRILAAKPNTFHIDGMSKIPDLSMQSVSLYVYHIFH